MQAEKQSGLPDFDDARVQAVYQILCSEEAPPGDKHWEGFAARRIVAALSHPSTPQGWRQIGWTCGDGDCGRIHESPGAEGSYAVPVYVPAPHTKETSP